MPEFDSDTLNAAATRLFAHADAITNAARRDIAADLRLAARIAATFASFRFSVMEIAARTTDAAAAADLRGLLAGEG